MIQPRTRTALLDAQGKAIRPPDVEEHQNRLQAMADGLVLNVARSPDFGAELERLRKWVEEREAGAPPLTPGQTLMLEILETCSKFQRKCRRIIEAEIARRNNAQAPEKEILT